MKRLEAGSALIEFTGALILLGTLLTGLFQIGYTLYTYETLIQAVRAGARYAALSAPKTSADPEFTNAVRNLVVYGDPRPDAKAKPITPGLVPDQVDVFLEPAAATVSLRGFTIDAVFRKISLDGRPTVTFPITSGVAR
jgi:Flp pilus assembly protein TadG